MSPRRTCVACRTTRDQRELLRVARGADGAVTVGRTAPGRGAYVCPEAGCIRTALRGGVLARALRGPLRDADLATLRQLEEEMA